MLRRLLARFEQASDEPLELRTLSRDLGIEFGALQGMVDFLAQRGRLVELGGTALTCRGCAAREMCPLIAPAKRYMLRERFEAMRQIEPQMDTSSD
jgi:hypothetical protein